MTISHGTHSATLVRSAPATPEKSAAASWNRPSASASRPLPMAACFKFFIYLFFKIWGVCRVVCASVRGGGLVVMFSDGVVFIHI